MMPPWTLFVTHMSNKLLELDAMCEATAKPAFRFAHLSPPLPCGLLDNSSTLSSPAPCPHSRAARVLFIACCSRRGTGRHPGLETTSDHTGLGIWRVSRLLPVLKGKGNLYTTRGLM